ncbi:MAG: uracil-DNA glycosylase family protein [Novosphingobium sp.]
MIYHIDFNKMIEIETHPLAPFLPANAKLLMMGSFPPPPERWKMQFYYPNFQNDMWRIFGLVFFDNKEHFLDLSHKKFHEELIRNFLIEKGIAIFDTAYQIRRLKGNAADQFLQVVTPTNLENLLQQIPLCHALMTTGDKATDTLMQQLPEGTIKPTIGQPSTTFYADRELQLFRMPSSSRAYPLALEKKAQSYADFFQKIHLL